MPTNFKIENLKQYVLKIENVQKSRRKTNEWKQESNFMREIFEIDGIKWHLLTESQTKTSTN